MSSASVAAQLRIAALAADRAVHRAFGWLHLHEPRMRGWQMQAIGIPAPTFGEAERAAWFQERFVELGLAEAHIDAAGNVCGVLDPAGPDPGDRGRTRPAVLLSAHLDTVFPPGTPCTPVEDGSRIRGPGACDNAAGLAALLGLAAALRMAQFPLACPVLFCANVGEEGEGDLRGMRHLFGPQSAWHGRLAAALALEGAGTATVVDRALGSRRFRLRVSGPGGHSWADAALPNPIFALSDILSAVSRVPLPSAPRTTLHAGTISGGTSVNSVPAEVQVTQDLRSTSEAQLRATAAELETTVHTAFAAFSARQSPGRRLQLALEPLGARPAGALPAGSPLWSSLRAVDRHLRIATEPRIGSTDANLPLSLGVSALAVGAGGVGAGIHTLAEWYDPAGRELALRRILLLLLDTCALVAAGELTPQMPGTQDLL